MSIQPSSGAAGGSAPTSDLPGTPGVAPRVAAVVSGVQSLGLVAVTAGYVVELSTGRATESGTAVMSLAVTAVFAVLLAVVSLAWWRGRLWPRTPTIVWNVLLLPVIWTLRVTNGPVVALVLVALAVTGILAAVLSPPADPPSPED